jgi:hypothetical protein
MAVRRFHSWPDPSRMNQSGSKLACEGYLSAMLDLSTPRQARIDQPFGPAFEPQTIPFRPYRKAISPKLSFCRQRLIVFQYLLIDDKSPLA